MSDNRPLLELDSVDTYYGPIHILQGLSLVVRSGELVCLLGGNASGKSTTLKTVLGIVRPRNGRVRFDGESIVGLPPHAITNRGIARTFQTLRLFLNMTVKENVMAAAYGRTHTTLLESLFPLPGTRAHREEKEVNALAEEMLGFFGQRLMGYRWNQPAYSLSYANRRRLEIARALALKPRILLLDEPAAGMNPAETHEITELIARIREERGQTILVIEHDMHVVASCSDRVVALDHGVKIAEGGFDAVASHPAVVEAYLGRDPEALSGAG